MVRQRPVAGIDESQHDDDRPTIREVAQLARVSPSTVSRALNSSGYVAPATRERILSAVTELGFLRNEAARSLRPGQFARTVGIKVGDLTNPFYAQFAMGAVKAARRAGWAVMLGTADEDPAEEHKFLDSLLSHRVAGLITVPDDNHHQYLLNPDETLRVPVVFVDRPAEGLPADEVVIDNEGGARLAVEQFTQRGHRRIAIIIAPSHYTTYQRYLGYQRALADAGIDEDPALVKQLTVGSSAAAAQAMDELLDLDVPPTAVFTTTNFLSEGAIAALTARNTSMALIGFDDINLAGLLPTPLSVVRCDVAAMGELAVQLLISRAEGSTEPPARHVVPIEYVARGSGELPPAA